MEKCAAAGRHNRMQDTLPPPLFAAAGPDFSFEPVIMTNGSSFTSHLPHARVRTQSHSVSHTPLQQVSGVASEERCDHDSAPQGGGNRMTVGASGGRGAGCVGWPVGESIRRLHAHTRTHTPMKSRRGCCLNAWNAVGLIKVKNKRGKRGSLEGVSGPDHVQQRRERGFWNVPVVLLVQRGLEFNSLNLKHQRDRRQSREREKEGVCVYIYESWNCGPSCGHKANSARLVSP